MKLFVLDSNPGCSFAAYCSDDNITILHTTDVIEPGEMNNINKSPDKLIQCLYNLSINPEIDLSEIDAVSVTIGPGSFTGIRVGLAIAKGIADSLDKKIIPINNFELLLNRVKNTDENMSYCALIPAKPPEYYYSVQKNFSEIKSGILQLGGLNQIIDKNVTIVSDFSDETDRNLSYFTLVNPKDLLPEEETIIKLSRKLFAKGDLFNPGDIKPLYLKDFTFRT